MGPMLPPGGRNWQADFPSFEVLQVSLVWVKPGIPHWREWLITVELLVLTSLEQLLLILQTLFATLSEEVNRTEPSLFRKTSMVKHG